MAATNLSDGVAPAVLSPEEAAAYLRLPVTTIRAALRRGEIPAARIACRWRIRRADLDRLFVAGRVDLPAPAGAPAAPAPIVVGDPERNGQVGRPRKARRRSVDAGAA